MAITSKVQGQDLMAYIKKDNGELKSIGFAVTHSFSTSLETIQNSNKDEGCGIYESLTPGIISWQITSTNFLSVKKTNGHNFDDIFDIYLERKPVEVAFGLAKETADAKGDISKDWEAPKEGWTPNASNHYAGSALITNLEVTADNGQAVQYNITLQGCGTLRKVGDGFVDASTVSLNNNGVKVETATATVKK